MNNLTDHRLTRKAALLVGLVGLVAVLSVVVAGGALADTTATVQDSPDIEPAQDNPAVNTTERTLGNDVVAPGDSTTVEMTVEMDEDEFELSGFALVELTDTFSPAFANVETVDVTPGGGSGGPGPDDAEYYAVWNEESLTYSVTYEVTVPDDAEIGDTFDISGTFEFGDEQVSLPDATVEVGTPFPESTGLELQPSDVTTGVDDSRTFDIVVTGADEGVESYAMNISLSDATVADITEYELENDAAVDDTTIAQDGSEISINVELSDTHDTDPSITVATITLDTDAVGTTNLDVADTSVTGQDGETYDIASASGATLTVEDPAGSVTITDQPSDGSALTIDEATYNLDQFVVVLHESDDGNAGAIVGTSEVFDAGAEPTDFDVALDAELDEPQEIIAMLHFVENGDVGDPIEIDGSVVQDSAFIDFDVGPPDIDVTGNGEPATDTTGDGLLNDINGDGTFNIFDVQAFFDNFQNDAVQNNVEFFDFANDGNVNIFDVQALFDDL